MRMATAVGAALAAGVGVGCGSSATGPSGLRLTTDRPSYAAGDTVVVSVANDGRSDVVYGACPAYAVERRDGLGWRAAAAPPPSRPCIAIGYLLPPGGTTAVRAALPAALAPGRYRVRFAGAFQGAVTSAFTLQ